MRLDHLPPHLQSRHRLLAADAGKIVEEIIERIAPLEILEEGPHRHPRVHEYRGTAQDLGVAVHYL
jgi:hypothetical protein